jgi:hypothetical protein
MPTYTIESDVTVVENDEGETVFRLDIAILRDAVSIRQLIQDFGLSVSNADMRASVEEAVFQIVREDYDALNRQAVLQRAAAIEANLNAWSRTLP